MESLTTIPDNLDVFIDANIFIYHFCASSDVLSDLCSDFLLRVENSQLSGFTSTSVIAETLHRVMIYETINITGLDAKRAMKRFRKKSDLIKQLTQYSKIPEKIVEMGIKILSVTYQIIIDSQYWRDHYGLMVNDSIVMASIQELKIENLATNDSDFDNIPNLAVWKPSL